ncbi:MAG: hypothetical protein GFGODING_00189 [Flavobacteriales bacterium]|nr:hypothetical protein [Flavobacteriales bacterium]
MEWATPVQHERADQYLNTMKLRKTPILIGSCCVGLLLACQAGNKGSNETVEDMITIDPKGMRKVGTVDERFQSYNVEMVEVVGGEFWRPYKYMDSLPSPEAASTYDVSQKENPMYRKLAPIDLSDRRLVNLAKGLAPAYVRVSGTWANAVHFQDDDGPPAEKAPAGFVNVLTRSAWKGVVDFVKATDSKLVVSFAVSNGVRDAHGVWTPREAQQLVDYTRSIGGDIAAAELFNEPTMPAAGGAMPASYGSRDLAKDVAVFKAWVKSKVPGMMTLGPGSVGEGIPVEFPQAAGMSAITTDSLMSAEPRPVFDGFSYHVYGAVSMRMLREGPFTIKAEHALDDAWLRKSDAITRYYAGRRDVYMPGKPLWITETAEAAGGGDPFAATYLDCFRYLYQLASSARHGVQVHMHNTLAASEYSLIDQDTHLPKPNYWAAFLWAKLMGTEVYDAGEGAPGLYLFAHDTKGRKGSITVLVINTNNAATGIRIPSAAELYTMTSPELQGTTVLLNGQELQLDANDALPAIHGRPVSAGEVSLPPRSISFITLEQGAE